MSLQSYPIIAFGSNIDLIRQGHNFLTTNVGDLGGLQTLAKDTIVDAINGLQIAFSSLTLSAYPPLNNEQWITANTFSGPGTLNLFKLSSANELIVGQSLIPFSTLTDLGKTGTAYRAGYITTLNTDKVQSAGNLEIKALNTFTFTLNASNLTLTETSPTLLTLQTTGEGLDIKSTRTRLFTGSLMWDIDTSGHLVPGANTQNVGSTTTRVNNVYTKDINASGAATITGALSAGSMSSGDGSLVPVGSGMMWLASLASIPANYLALNGQVVSQATYPALYALYGTTYNTTGEGAGNFRLPNLTKQIPIGVDASQTSNPDLSSLGKTTGSINHTHTVPQHTHAVGSFATSGGGGGNHTHGQSTFSGAVNSAGSGISFDHTHGYDHTHGFSAFSIVDLGHAHGVGSYSAAAVGDHTHGAGSYGTNSAGTHDHNIAVEGGTSSGGRISWSNNGAPTSTKTGQISDAGAHTHTVTGSSGSAGSHGHSITGGSAAASANLSASVTIASVSQTYGSANTGTVNGGTGTPNDHRHSISSSGAHEHTVPSHTAGTGGVNGDAQMTSGTGNPPLFAVYFIVRAK